MVLAMMLTMLVLMYYCKYQVSTCERNAAARGTWDAQAKQFTFSFKFKDNRHRQVRGQRSVQGRRAGSQGLAVLMGTAGTGSMEPAVLELTAGTDKSGANGPCDDG